MSKIEHTPGPWRVEQMGFLSVRAGKMRICDIRGWGYLTDPRIGGICHEDDEAERILGANARLIAAAPDLLVALTELLAHASFIGIAPHYDAMARAAIAKAEGRQP